MYCWDATYINEKWLDIMEIHVSPPPLALTKSVGSFLGLQYMPIEYADGGGRSWETDCVN